jgi:tRNA nucleotidyltransferase (CCA-adding enzyme)
MGGGGGGGGYFVGRVDPSDLARKISDATESAEGAAYEAAVNQLLGAVLAKLNDRDAETVQRILDRIKADFGKEFDGTVDVLFGGSVAKNTYLEGISDIDALVLLKEDQIGSKTPSAVQKKFADLLQARYGESNVRVGRLAVTLTIDGKEIQLVPAIREGMGINSPSKIRSEINRNE